MSTTAIALLREEPIGHAAGEERDRLAGDRIRDNRRDCCGEEVCRARRGRSSGLRRQSRHRLRQRRLSIQHRHAAQADELAAARDRELGAPADPGRQVEGLRALDRPRARPASAAGSPFFATTILRTSMICCGSGILDRADRLAGIAGEAHALRLGDRVEPVMELRHDQADRAGVDVAEDMAADFAIRRADIGAGAAADAVQRLPELRHRAHLAAAVVDQDDVHLVPGGRAGDEGGVDGHPLPGAAAAEQAELGDGVVEGRDQLFDAGHARCGPGAPTTTSRPLPSLVHIMTVPDLGDQRVGAGHADPGGRRTAAGSGRGWCGPAPGCPRCETGDVQLVVEQLADILPSHVQRGTDDVARALAGLLHDPLAEIGLDALDAAGPRGSG